MSSVPRVAVSMLTLVPGAMGGSETYARELVRELARTDEVEAIAYLSDRGAGFGEGLPERVVAAVGPGSSSSARLRTMARLTLRGPRLRRAMVDADVVHFPFTVAVPRPSRRQAMVQTLLDVQHLDLPELFSRAELAYRRVYYEGTARRARAIVTISQFAKQRMVDLLGFDPERIHVAHLGVRPEDFEVNAGPREPFVLYPARGWKHKNHARLVTAMTIVRAERPDLRLVLTGGGLDALGELPEWVERAGLVSRDELAVLYRRASVLAFPSLYEGFGLPPLEAMASGCPVAASAVGSIPEVCGDAAVLFDPRDPEAIAAGILEAIGRTTELREAGLRNIRSFTWERCRDVHVQVYRGAV